MNKNVSNRTLAFTSALLLIFWTTFHFGIGWVEAARVSDIRATKHNLSSMAAGTATRTGTVPARDITATSTDKEVCIFCHTPHAATSGAVPLWNRSISATYTTYKSSSMDSLQIDGIPELAQPDGSSKLCLSCHDGTIAIGSVNVYAGKGGEGTTQTIPTKTASTGATNGTMPAGSYGEYTGFTRIIGKDLQNDHPISLTYNGTLADQDGELRTPASPLVAVPTKGFGGKPKLPLELTNNSTDGQIQCATCHDPHYYDDDATVGNIKFLRLNRFQGRNPTTSPSTFDSSTGATAGDIICLACHDKNAGTSAWAYSAHANPAVATHYYKQADAIKRDFPTSAVTTGGTTSTLGPQVWQVACLNCHDTHTVKGAKRLLREGTTDNALGAGSAALENTCYQCHTTATSSAVQGGSRLPPDIYTEFDTPNTAGGGTAMPIGKATETHDIGGTYNNNNVAGQTNAQCGKGFAKCGADFLESRESLKARHVECTDCHNPHRVIKAQNGLPGAALASTNTNDSSATHVHDSTGTIQHSNKISGVLRGMWGVEPVYSTQNFNADPTSTITYKIKRGDPGTGGYSTGADDVTYVTREYQICLKCHSNYGYDETNRPAISGKPMTTSANANGLSTYTNQAREFQAPTTHKGEGISYGKDGGAGAAFDTNNHRSWHPVMGPTGRTGAIRGNQAGGGSDISSNWIAPFATGVGNLTMYCTDCHGASNGNTANSTPGTKPWGPHGSSNNFILRGTWDNESGANQATTLCLKCHKQSIYAPSTQDGSRTGFYLGEVSKDGHTVHSARSKISGGIECTWCHVAVPHGWKNKAFLVNLNDVGPEADATNCPNGGCEVRIGDNNARIHSESYTQAPYYLEAKLKIRSFRKSGEWTSSDCGSRGGTAPLINPPNLPNKTTNSTQTGTTWMKDTNGGTCKTPP